jgi:hypothetical protein
MTKQVTILNSQDVEMETVEFESLHPGDRSDTQTLTLKNQWNGATITVSPVTSTSQEGSDSDTWMSMYLSTDGVTYTNTFSVYLGNEAEQTFYTYYQPPSNGLVGEKEWVLGITNSEFTFLEGYDHFTDFSITGSSDGELTDYQVMVTVPYYSFMQNDFDDIRFTLTDATNIDYALISKTNGVTATFLLKIPTIPVSPGTVTILIFGGNSSATSASSPGDTYLYYDSGSEDNSSNYTLVDIMNTGINATFTYDAVNDCYKFTIPSVNDAAFAKINTLTSMSDLILECDLYRNSTTANTQAGVIARKKTGENYLVGRYEVAGGTNRLGITEVVSGSWIVKDTDNHTLPLTTWYTCSLSMYGTTAYMEWYDNNGTLVHTETATINATLDSGDWGLYSGLFSVAETWFKNIRARKTTTNPPTVGSLGTWLEIPDHTCKGGLYYQSQDLDELDVYPRFGVQLGENYYE